MKKTGTADLPLHGGRAPRWLFNRMVRLSSAITEVIVQEYGQKEFLLRIADPHWFQAFTCVIGFDWHSSGTTTTACGALKMAITPETGIIVAGGKGAASRKTPAEIEKAAEVFPLSTKEIEELKYASRISAKVDNTCIQDSYQLYHHSFFLTEEGEWAVVQQGMNENYARRYHWLSDNVESFVEEPHSGICSDRLEKKTLDMTSRKSEEARKTSVDLVNDNPGHLLQYLREGKQKTLIMPSHHPVLEVDVGRGGFEVLRKAYEIQPQNYEELIALKGIGPKRVRALALVSEIVYGAEPSWKDPARFSFAHGGKDGFPYPVDRKTYDHTINTLQEAVDAARIDQKEKLYAIKRLRDFL
ncbi:MAG: DUF763 domain-containing protein [Candidatus Altiarchaeota archaeon]|nr:DUF763 domain-containing protein [Candidatus Altiarchaeota archaeon]